MQSVLSEVTERPLLEIKNPIILKELETQKRLEDQEAKLQEQVATIFKDKKFYSQFQENALNETPEERQKRIETEKQEKAKRRQETVNTANMFAKTLGGPFMYAAGQTLTNTSIQKGAELIGKGASLAGHYIKGALA
jgi:hypothetical protein